MAETLQDKMMQEPTQAQPEPDLAVEHGATVVLARTEAGSGNAIVNAITEDPRPVSPHSLPFRVEALTVGGKGEAGFAGVEGLADKYASFVRSCEAAFAQQMAEMRSNFSENDARRFETDARFRNEAESLIDSNIRDIAAGNFVARINVYDALAPERQELASAADEAARMKAERKIAEKAARLAKEAVARLRAAVEKKVAG
jgi:hypothetical protein